MSVLQVGSMEKKLLEGLTVFTQRLNYFVSTEKMFGYSKAFLKAPNGLMMNWRNVDLLGLEKGYRLLGKILI